MSQFSPQQEDAFTPQQAMQLIARSGEKKCKMRLDKFIYNSILGGAYIGFGCAAALVAGDAPWFQENAPGPISVLAGAVFPVGLITIALTGAELWTSTVFYTTVALLERRATVLGVLKTWAISFIANCGGILFFCFPICIWGGVFSSASAQAHTVDYAVGKAQDHAWHEIFLSAIGCNWLVCLAVYQGTIAREVISKIFAIWWPIFIFVMLGFNHVIANFFLVPIGIYYGAPFGVGYYIWKSLIPAALGNIIGGAGFVGVSYWYLWLTAEEEVAADFDTANVFVRNCQQAAHHDHGREDKMVSPYDSSHGSKERHHEFNNGGHRV
ncbi:hypothetical protein MBLNU230_g3550t1 [Neophaeotheca triangularis]